MNTNRTNQLTYGEVIAINVDIQKDFCPDGALAVNDGDQVVGPANKINEWVASQGGQSIFTADWHPRTTTHFAEFGGPWPVHCVADTDGATFHPNLVINPANAIAHKGMSGLDDGYSGYEAMLTDRETVINDVVADLPKEEKTVGLAVERIIKVNRALGARTALLVFGLAGDYCVSATAKSALDDTDREWTDVIWVIDAVRSVDVNIGDGEQARRALEEAGMLAMSIEDILNGGIVIDRGRLER